MISASPEEEKSWLEAAKYWKEISALHKAAECYEQMGDFKKAKEIREKL